MPPRPPKVLGFSPSDFNRVARMLKDYEQGFPQLLSKRTPYTPGQNHQWVKLDSTTPSSGRYDGKWYERDESTPGWTAKDDVWVVFANGTTPNTAKYYLAMQTGYQSSRPVFCVFDQTDVVDGIGQYTALGVEIDIRDYAVAATSATATLLEIPSNIIVAQNYHYLTTEVTGSGSKTFQGNFYIRFDSTDYLIGDTGFVGNTLPSPYAASAAFASAIRGNGITNYSGTHELKVVVNSVSGSGNLNTFSQGKAAFWFFYWPLPTF